MSAALIEAFTPPRPRPLVPMRSPALPYPFEALGPILGGAAAYTVEATQCDFATAAHSVLGAACLAAQAHADVRTPAGIKRPISLFLLTIAESGERKSAADAIALRPVREIEDEDREPYNSAFRQWRNNSEAIEAERAKIKRATKGDAAMKREALEALGPIPPPPLRPERTVSDATAEGLIKSWLDCPGSRGLFTDEGAKVIAGHSMSPESRLRTAATYSSLWDDGRAERLRAGDGFLSLRGRRLAVHLMAQPAVAAGFIGAGDLTDQGLIGRFLVCRAVERAGTRLFKEPPGDGDPRFTAYRRAIRALLRLRPRALGGPNELDPRALTFTHEARQLWIGLHDEIEAKLKSDGELGGVRAFGSKLAEHMARLAAVLTLIEDVDASEIGEEVMDRVIDLAGFYASEAERLNAESRIEARLIEAEALRQWIERKWTEPLIRLRDVENGGPNALRPKAIAERCFATLTEYGHLVAEPGGRGERYRIVGRTAP